MPSPNTRTPPTTPAAARCTSARPRAPAGRARQVARSRGRPAPGRQAGGAPGGRGRGRSRGRRRRDTAQ
eukprot:4374846-Pyramimonas_sp.AAC.2